MCTRSSIPRESRSCTTRLHSAMWGNSTAYRPLSGCRKKRLRACSASGRVAGNLLFPAGAVSCRCRPDFIVGAVLWIEESPAERVAFPPESSNLMYGMYKLDGFRCLARRDGAGVRLLTRRGIDWTTRYPSIAAAVVSSSPETLVPPNGSYCQMEKLMSSDPSLETVSQRSDNPVRHRRRGRDLG